MVRSPDAIFQNAGIGAGTKVLDVGSGAGDVSLLLAELIGPSGRVVGVELNAAIIETARARVAAAGGNVRFVKGDVHETSLDSDFDAVAGRWVLMYQPQPSATLRHLASRFRPGGTVAFQENDFAIRRQYFLPVNCRVSSNSGPSRRPGHRARTCRWAPSS